MIRGPSRTSHDALRASSPYVEWIFLCYASLLQPCSERGRLLGAPVLALCPPLPPQARVRQQKLPSSRNTGRKRPMIGIPITFPPLTPSLHLPFLYNSRLALSTKLPTQCCYHMATVRSFFYLVLALSCLDDALTFAAHSLATIQCSERSGAE